MSDQLTRDAETLAGESFGDEQIEQLLQYIDSSNGAVSSGCLRALGELHAVSTVPAMIAVAPTKQLNACSALARIASPKAVAYLLAVIQSPDQSIRHRAIDALGRQGGRWPVPVLIELLDDASLRTTYKEGEQGPLGEWGFIWPDEHKAQSALFFCLSGIGLRRYVA